MMHTFQKHGSRIRAKIQHGVKHALIGCGTVHFIQVSRLVHVRHIFVRNNITLTVHNIGNTLVADIDI